MKSVRIFSKVLFYLARTLAFIYLAIFVYASISSFAHTASFQVVEHNTRFEIYYPFTDTPFLLGYNTMGYINTMLMVFGLYALFFYLLSNVFLTFSQAKLFTKKGLQHLKHFYLSNFFLPIMALLIASIISEVEGAAEALVALHLLLGIFAYFIAAIFQQGLKLQHEQDLFI